MLHLFWLSADSIYFLLPWYTLNNTREQGKHKEIKITLVQYIDIEKKTVIAKHFRPYRKCTLIKEGRYSERPYKERPYSEAWV